MNHFSLHNILGLFFFFLWGPVFKVFMEFVTILFIFYVLGFYFCPQGVWDLSSLTRD